MDCLFLHFHVDGFTKQCCMNTNLDLDKWLKKVFEISKCLVGGALVSSFPLARQKSHFIVTWNDTGAMLMTLATIPI